MLGMVFAAGLGTRLRPLTDLLPKPVVPLLNRPLASYSLERLGAFGIARVAINTHHLAHVVDRVLRQHAPDGMDVRFVHEPTLLGTGGGLHNAWKELGEGEPIIVMNGDILFWPDLEGALALHRELDAIATVVLRPDPRARKLGALEIDGEGRVRRLLGVPHVVDAPLRELMFTGVHVLSARAFADLPAEGCIIRSSYRKWIDEGQVVGGFVDSGPWRDLGTPAEYLNASLDLLRGDVRWPGIEPRSAMVAEGSEVQHVHLSEVVVGPGAVIAGGRRLERAIVWPGTLVLDDATDAILAHDLRVPAT